ncbi:MAG: hypothetical protein LUD07_07945 [Clostridiales bacterium]|nr:hypothetical protein [Clostridiales bacterium]
MQFREMLRDEHDEGVQEGLREGLKKGLQEGLKQRDQMLIFKWSADGRELSEIASLLSITEEEVRKVLAENMIKDCS